MQPRVPAAVPLPRARPQRVLQISSRARQPRVVAAGVMVCGRDALGRAEGFDAVAVVAGGPDQRVGRVGGDALRIVEEAWGCLR